MCDATNELVNSEMLHSLSEHVWNALKMKGIFTRVHYGTHFISV